MNDVKTNTGLCIFTGNLQMFTHLLFNTNTYDFLVKTLYSHLRPKKAEHCYKYLQAFFKDGYHVKNIGDESIILFHKHGEDEISFTISTPMKQFEVRFTVGEEGISRNGMSFSSLVKLAEVS